MEFKKLQLEKANEIDSILRRYLPEPAGEQAACMEDMAYSVLGGGKRLRPMLMRETCGLFTEDTSVAEPFMAAMEMIHTYSLIHDDIMDDDDARRGRPTVHAKYRVEFMEKYGEKMPDACGNSVENKAEAEGSCSDKMTGHRNVRNGGIADAPEKTAEAAKKFGENMGILAGDALLTYAFEIMADAVAQEFEAPGVASLEFSTGSREKGTEESTESCEKGMVKSPTPCEKESVSVAKGVSVKNLERAAAKIRAISLIAKKAGVGGMVGGQIIDVQNIGMDMTADQVKNINELKTSALIEASMMAGAMLGGADDAAVVRIERAASLIGQAFQIEDDILDVTGNAAALGKPVGSDDKNDKNTYVRIYGLEKCRRMVEELSEEAICILKGCSFNRKSDGFLEELLRSLVNRDH